MNIQLRQNQSQSSYEIELKQASMTLKDELKYKLITKTCK
jgi:uncharacterized protein YdcH (DUF465 family)